MTKMPLSLNPDPEPVDAGEGASGPAARTERKPVLGWLAIGFGLLGIFTNGTIFVPLAFICSMAALFFGQVAWAFGGFLLTVAGLLTSPVLVALLGLGVVAAYFGLPL